MARTLDQLAIIANQIKDATLQGENTADRVGGLLVDLIDFLRTINVDEIALSPLLTALNESGLVDPQDGQILRFKSSEDNWVFSSDITQITNTIRTILDTLGHLDNGFVKKTGDIMTGLLTTLAGIKVRNFLQLGDRFVSGLLGEGAIFRENVGGRTYLEADEMYIRVKAYFDTVEIRKFLHSGGNRIASVSGAKCIRVEMLNSANEIVTEYPTKYRCYFRASDGDNTVTNDFVVGDQAYCHVTNATNSSLNMHHYWRLVVGKNESPTENGEHWIDLSNQESETIDGIAYSGYLNISDAPAAQDDIIQLGNVNDITRRGAIIEFVSGNDAPSYQIFQGLGDIGTASTIEEKHNAQYSYTDKNYISLGYNSSTGRAYLNVFGDFLFGDRNGTTYVKYDAGTKQLDIKATVHFISPTTHQETTLDTFASAITGGLENLQRQIDGEIDTWFYNGTPGPSVLPESEWVAIDTQTGTNNERLKHLGDLYYDNSTGYAYRYTNTGSEASPVFTWSQISDSAVIKALEDAAKAQDTADHKRRTFVTTAGVLPTPPYSEGDLWVNATYPYDNLYTDDENHRYYKDLLKCTVPATYDQQGNLVREGVEAGETPLISHWNLASKYTDDSYAKQFDYLKTAIQDAPPAQIQGGLILASTMAMRDLSSNIMSGISGLINEDLTDPMMSIAAWFGGGIHDFENHSAEEEAEYESLPSAKKAIYYAKSLFRHNGSGYLAGGNISWDTDGALTIQGATLRAVEGSSTIEITTAQIASINWVNSNFISKAWFNKFFVAHYKRNNTDYTLAPNNDFPDDATDKTLESVFSFWTNYAISALGQGVDGSHAIGVLDDLNDVTLTNPTANQVLTYNGTHWVNRTLSLGSQSLAGLSDVSITTPSANQILSYDVTTQKWVNATIPATGVTSVALSMPTGFSITGSPITSSGTFTVTFASGYSLPTTAKQSNWDTAYSWGNHASAGYALAANLGTASSHAHSDYLTSLSWDSTNKKLAWSKGGTAQTAITIGYASMAGITGMLSATSYINGTTSELPHLIWHIPNTNWGNLSMDSGGNFFFRSSNSTSAGYANLYANLPDYLAKTGGTMTGAIKYSNDRSGLFYIGTGNTPSGYTTTTAGGNTQMGVISWDGASDEGGILVGSDCCTIYNSGDSEYILKVMDKDVSTDLSGGYSASNCLLAVGQGSNAAVYVKNLYSSGAVSALSDIRHKEIVRNTNLQVEQIAAMRSVIYRKKDSNDNTLYAGSIAQDWQSILPQVVSVADNDEHTQSLQYGVAALISVITTARKVAEHEQKIKEQAQKISELEQVCSFLKKENIELKDLVNNLKIA